MERDTNDERKEQRLRRMERMKREKQLQEERRQKIRQYLPLAIGVFGIIVVLLTVIAAGVGKMRKNEEKQPQNEIPTEEASYTEETSEEETGTVTEEEQETITYQFAATADTAAITDESVISTHAVLIDAEKNTIAASRLPKERINPASMTKVLTLLTAADHITEEDFDDIFTMTREITDYAYVNDCSSVGFLDGEKVTVRDLLYGTILPSGGDAAVGLATYVAGSHESFVAMMNEKLAELGLSGSAHMTNAVGLYDKNHYCTVYDMAVMMKAAMENELCREILSSRTYTTSKTTEHPDGITVSNWFIRRIEDKETGGEVIAGKTGYVVQSGNCAVSYAVFGPDKKPYICVTAGSHSSWRCIYDHVDIYSRYAVKNES